MNLFTILVSILIKSIVLFEIQGLFFAKNLAVIYVLKQLALNALFFVLFLVALVSLINLLNIAYVDRIDALELVTFSRFLLFLKNFILIFSRFFQVS